MPTFIFTLLCLFSGVTTATATETDGDVARAFAVRLNEHILRSCPNAFARSANQLLYWSAKPRDWSAVPGRLEPALGVRVAHLQRMARELSVTLDPDDLKFGAFSSLAAWLDTYVRRTHFSESTIDSAARAQAPALYELQRRLARLNKVSVARVIQATEIFLDPDQMLVQAFENASAPPAALDVGLRSELGAIAPGLVIALRHEEIDRDHVQHLIAERLNLNRDDTAARVFRPRELDYFAWRALPPGDAAERLLGKLNDLRRVIEWLKQLESSRPRNAVLDVARAYAAELGDGVRSLTGPARCVGELE